VVWISHLQRLASNLLLGGEEQRVIEREECKQLGVNFHHSCFFDTIDKDETRRKESGIVEIQEYVCGLIVRCFATIVVIKNLAFEKMVHKMLP